MAVTSGFYGNAIKDMASGTVILHGRPIGAVLLSAATFDQDNAHFLSDVMSHEIAQGGANSGYTSLGATVGNGTVTYDGASNETRWDIADPVWPTSTFSANQMALYYRSAGGTTTNWPLIQFIDFGGTQTVSSGTFTYQVPATGSGVITASTIQ